MAKIDKKQDDDLALEAFFRAARSETVDPSDQLMSAILADADRLQSTENDVTAEVAPPTLPAPRRSPLQSILSAIGGWPSAAGMATATVAGVWIGFAQPVTFENLSGGLLLSGDYLSGNASYTLEDMAPSYLNASLFAEDEG